MNPRTIETLWLAFCVLAFAAALAIGCGSVSPFPELGAGGASGAAGGLDTAGVGGAGGELGQADAGVDVDAGPVVTDAEAPGDAPKLVCISNDTPGFAFNGTCDGGGPTSPGCHASCELNGAPFVGCVHPSAAGPYAWPCVASCSACP